MLVDNQETLAAIFRESPVMIVTHCEDTPSIKVLEDEARAKWGEDVPMREHGRIRSADACYKSSSMAVSLAKQYGAKLHVLHLTTAKELSLFTATPDLKDLKDKNITAEVCVHHLFFNEADYDTLGSQIKCNPAVKSAADQHALLDAVRNDVLDIIATDHAPTPGKRSRTQLLQGAVRRAPGAALPAGAAGALPQRGLQPGNHRQEDLHAVAERFQVQDRGYIREGYFADLVLLDLGKPYVVTDSNLLYLCGWSPFNGYRFQSTIEMTLVNGQIAWQNGQVTDKVLGKRLTFNR